MAEKENIRQAWLDLRRAVEEYVTSLSAGTMIIAAHGVRSAAFTAAADQSNAALQSMKVAVIKIKELDTPEEADAAQKLANAVQLAMQQLGHCDCSNGVTSPSGDIDEGNVLASGTRDALMAAYQNWKATRPQN